MDAINSVLSKLSSYNIVNYLIPGSALCLLVKQYTNYSVFQDSLILNIVICYVAGLVNYSVGASVIEKLYKKWKIVKYEEYSRYIDASKSDERIKEMSEVNNMFRSFVAVGINVLAVMVYGKLDCWLGLSRLTPWLLAAILLVIVSMQYRKQTAYIVKRIKKVCDPKQDSNSSK